MDPIPSSVEIERRLLEFLRRLAAEGSTGIGAAKSVAWVFSEDCVFYAQALRIRVPLAADNARVAERLLQSDAARRIGVEVRAFGTIGECVYCTLYVPESLEDARSHAIGGLKLAVPTQAVPLGLAESAILWRLMRFFGKPSTMLHVVMTPMHVARVLAGSCERAGDPD
ncbi:MAG: hypothetical protein M0R80_12935 [Proteobacteria bacterium]|jgi:hypothetical protein|nr:hypothetical protein [Pseudomonadota bacterium]